MNNLTIKNKLFLKASATAFAFFVILIFSFTQVAQNIESWQDYDSATQIELNLIDQIQQYFGYGFAIHNFKNAVLRKDLEYIHKAKKDFDQAIALISQLKATDVKQELPHDQIDIINSTLKEYRRNSDQVEKMIIAGNTPEQIDQQVRIDDSQTILALESLRQSIKQHVKQSKIAFLRSLEQTPYRIVGAFLLAMLVSVVISIYIANSIDKSIQYVVKNTESIAHGDLSTPLLAKGSDEMAKLTQSVEIMRQSLLENMTKLQASNTDLEQYAYIVSHDLQEPLRKIFAFSERIEKKLQDQVDEDTQFALSRILSAAKRMSQLIDDLLDYSRVSRRSKELTTVDLNEVIHDVLTDLELYIKEKKALIHVDNMPKVKSDPVLLRQLFQNLIQNSLKFSRNNTPPIVEVTFSKDEDENYLYLHIKDNGIGFPMEQIHKIIRPFQRLHARDEYSGSGIGLAICNKIIITHGWELEIKSEINQGSDFAIKIPRRV